jgi:hypothetical protein
MKVYVVVGVYSGDEISTILSNYGVKSTLEKAKEELQIIKQETLEQIKDNDCLDAEIIESELGLRIIYDNDDEDYLTNY